MPSAADFGKIPLLLGSLWAHSVAYCPPHPSPAETPSQDGKEAIVAPRARNMRPQWTRKVSRWTARIVILCEILAILATRFPSRISTFILSVLDQGTPRGRLAEHLRITPSFAIGWALVMSGAFLRLACYRAMGKHFTFDITIRKDHRLITSGPYSVVRHPGYSAASLVVLGNIICFFGRGSWLRESGILSTAIGKVFAVAWLADLLYVPSIMIFMRLKVEDRLLRKEFGAEWDEWARRTPYALIPGIY